MCEWLKTDYSLDCTVQAADSGSGGASSGDSGSSGSDSGSGADSGSGSSGSGDSSGSSGGSEPAEEEVSASEAAAALADYEVTIVNEFKAASGYNQLETSKKEAIDEAIQA